MTEKKKVKVVYKKINSLIKYILNVDFRIGNQSLFIS